MANRFNQWVPTQYVSLPIDYYQSALVHKEQQAEQALENINAVVNAYGSIKPVSKDPQALYDQTSEKLRARVAEINKKDLTTPTAQREVMKLLQDPEFTDPYEKIYSDTLFAAQARKDLNEYLKKNPEVNAVDYLSAFSRLGSETGDPTKFNPDRFKNMSPLTDYFDINKRIEEGIARLHPDSQEVKDIVGPYYTEYKKKGLLPQKIREYVSSQIGKDPLVRGQMQRNLRYKGYLTNQADPAAGLQELGQNYRDAISQNRATLQQGLAELYAGRDEKGLIEARKDKAFAQREADLLANLETSKAYLDPTTGDVVDPNTLAALMERDSLVYGFDSMGYLETLKSKRYSPLYIAQQTAAMNFQYRRRLQAEKMKATTDMLADAMSFTYDKRNQVPITPSSWSEYLKTRIPELNGVVLGPNGEFTPENYKKDLIEVRKGEFYLPSDVDVTVKQGTGFTSGGGGSTPTISYHLKPGAKPVSNTAEGAAKMFNEGKSKIQSYLNKFGISANYDLNNEVDLKRAIQDIVAFNQQNESIYTPIVTDPTSNSPTRINRVKESLNYAKVFELGSSGGLKEVGKDARAAIRKHLQETKGAQVRFQPVSMSGKSYDVVSVNGNDYYIESTPLQQSISAQANGTVNMMMNAKEPVVVMPDGSLFMKFMGPNGQMQTGVIQGGGNEDAQATLKATWDANINKLVKETGMTKEAAERSLLSNMNSGGAPFKILGDNGKAVDIDIPIGRYKSGSGKTYYYSWGGTQKNPFMGVGDVIRGTIKQTQSTLNPERVYDIFPYLRSANKEDAGINDDIISNVFQDLEQD